MKKPSAKRRHVQKASARMIHEGLALHRLGKFPEAEAVYRKVLETDPENFDAWHLLGVMAQQIGMPQESVTFITHAIGLSPANPTAYYNLGVAYSALGNPEQAAICYQKAISLKPGYAEAHGNLGIIFQESGRFEEAARHYQKALSANPDHAEAHNNLGNIFQDQGLLEAAMKHYRQALSINPGLVDAWNNMGNALKSQGSLIEAIDCYSKAIALKPDYALAYNNLGTVFQDQGKFDEALHCLNKTIALDPDHAKAHYNLGVLFQEQGKSELAIKSFRKVLALDAEYHAARSYLLHQLQQICEWHDLDEQILAVRHAVIEAPVSEKSRISTFAFLALPGATPIEQKICAEKWAQIMYGHLAPARKKLAFEYPVKPGKKIHVGYLSADFREHPVSQLMAEVFELHDRAHFRIFAYSYGTDDHSAMRERVTNAFDEFADIREFSIEDAARKINSDRIDILIDLSGYTTSSRSGILALRPAPVQMSYIGYLGTMGADFVDYILADHFLIPDGSEAYYSEKIAYLPSYQANDRRCVVGEKPARSACGLPEEGFVFCCFNQPYKISPDIFDIWMRLLRAKPGSVFWLHAVNPSAVENLRREAEARGIPGNRLIFAERLPLAQHLGRLKCADLFLDTLPYNAGTTASNALWVGLPVLTCPGETFASRMAGSLLAALDVPELIASNLEDYYSRALELASNEAMMIRLREKIAAHRDSTLLFDSERFTRNLESVFTEIIDEQFQPRIFPDSRQVTT